MKGNVIYMIFIFMVVLAIIVGIFIYSRSRYQNKSDAGAFFFEDNKLVLNTGIPSPIPLVEIDYVKLKFHWGEVDHGFSYSLAIKVVKKNGKSKTVFYKGYRTAKLALPTDMAAALEEKGIRCEMPERR